MFGPLGIPELLLIFGVILIVFGPRRLPEVGSQLGKFIGEFRKATDDLKSTIEREVRLEELKKIAPSIVTPYESISRSEPVSYPAQVAPAPIADDPLVSPAPEPAQPEEHAEAVDPALPRTNG